MNGIKRYIDCYIPTETCNLRCHYCYITQRHKFNGKLVHFPQSPETIRKALSKERLGGTCLLNLCAGGETLLSEEVLHVTKQLLLEGHYVVIVTNGTITKRFEEIAGWPKEILNRLFFKFSFHYLEMKRLNMMERFFSNVQLMKNAGASFTVEITPSDELVPYIDEVKAECLAHVGALCHVTIARDERTEGFDVLSDYSFEEYKKIWGQFGSELFRFKSEIFYKHRDEFCYAGDWSAQLMLDTGVLKQCYYGKVIDNIYEHIDRPIHFEAIGHDCTMAHCFNGHSFLALGDIPEIDAPTYTEVRNRICEDGSEWLQPEMKRFMGTKLYENNKEYNVFKKAKNRIKKACDFRRYLSQYRFYKVLRRIIRGK